MAVPIAFPQANKTLGPPTGHDENVAPLSVYTDGRQCVSIWQLTDAEREEVARTGCIHVNVLYGNTQPPIYVWAGKLSEGLF